ncbi:TetR/AcrR family transcriptional regulator [Aidingimonas lacisalsi]|uniref:TetR/AcrR family transcriptional regulator n=1 Tax=Aidingimonas lacisalsi TaxID=2604086 RepID=UPI0013762542|nr:TetR/AcrR family transcriptional regulator [Aidingimonas lacisalsi]
MVRYAHAKEDKEARRDNILGAALCLFLQDTRHLPAVASIAAKAGLAKGTVYLYFDTKEQIFAALLSREWDALLMEVEASFAEPFEHKASPIARFIDRFAKFLDSHPYFLRFDSIGYVQVEANLPTDEFWRFKEAFASALDQAGRTVDTSLALSSGTGRHLLIRSYALARGLWQTLDLPERLRNDTRFANYPLANIDFDAELRSALQEYWHGALTLPV